jgi:hypothetical protein
MHVRRTIEKGAYVYHVDEAHPRGQVEKVALWRTDRGYFAAITLREDADSIVFDEYPDWGKLKAHLVTCLREELQCPELH